MAIRILDSIENGRRIAVVRKAAGLSGAHLGRLVGVSAQSISNWEAGKVSKMSLSTFQEIANACAGKGRFSDDPSLILDYLEGRIDLDFSPRAVAPDDGQPLPDLTVK